jgi:membrane protein implicated in regulation of membrane protease activity
MLTGVLYAYVALAIVGLVLLAASVLGAGHDAGHDAGGGHDDASSEHSSPASALLSVRVWTYPLAVGVLAAALARFVLGRASRAGASGTVQSRELVGRTADVIVPFGGGTTGKIRVRVAGGDVDVLATADDGEALAQHDEVLIVDLREGGTALVTRSPARPTGK